MTVSAMGALRAVLIGSVAMVALAAPAHAAEAAPAASSDGAAHEGEIVVTARKRSELLQDVPAAVSAISHDALDKAGAAKFEDYLTTVPGVNFVSGGEGTTTLILRGINTGGANSTVGTYIDEIPFGSSTSYAFGGALTPDLDPADIADIEVLRGPQGTLYGANAIGGILKFVTVKPNTGALSGQISVGVQAVDGGGSGGVARGALNIPLIKDKLAIRVSGYYRQEPGYIKDSFHQVDRINSADVDGGRVDILWTPSASYSLRASAMIHDVSLANNNSVDITQVQTDANRGYLGGWYYGDLTQQRYVNQPVNIHYKVFNVTQTLSLGGVDLLSSTSYQTQHAIQQGDETSYYGAYLNYLAPAIFPATLGYLFTPELHQSKLTQEVRIASSGKHMIDWQLGVFGTFERPDLPEPITLNVAATGAPYTIPAPYDAYNDIFFDEQLAHYRELSFFGNVDFHATDRLDVLIGVRESLDHQTYLQPTHGLLYGAPASPSGVSSENAFTFLFNPRWKISDTELFYIRIASGYRPGGPNGVPPAALNFPPSFKPDHLITYEGGWKADLFDRTLSIDTAVYYISWTDVQLPTVIDGYSSEGNGGKAHSQGFEGAVVWSPLRGLKLNGNLTYTNGKIDTVDNPSFIGAFPGDPLPFAPKWNFTLGGQYAWKFNATWSGNIGATYTHVGSRPNVYTVNTATSGYYVPIPGYNTLEVHAGIAMGPWSAQFFVKNLTNERGILSAAPETLSSTGPLWGASVLQPRTFGVNFSNKF